MENRIKEVLKEQGVSQKELAKMVGMSEPGISNAINGSATKETLQKVANALQVEINELVVEEGLYAKYSADKTPLQLGKVSLPCYVLNNGMRVFSGRGIQRALGYESKSGQWMNSFLRTEGLTSYFYAGENSVAKQLESPLKFKRNRAGGSQSVTYGYDATILIDICSAIIDANRAGDYSNMTIVTNADIIIRAVAKTGIIALVDEATGYDKAKERSKMELQSWLAKYINAEADKWVKMFPDSFFEDVYKMRGWSWDCKPRYIGKIINDVVYERIAPFILEELRKKNPKLANGNRKYKFHQFLTSEEGKPLLKQHLAILHSFALATDYNWGRFMTLLDKAHPKQYQELAMFDEMETDEK